jgi:sugar/nucleoside kinase (ribokinase family)
VDVSEIELLCAARAYLDFTFTGLRALPRAGREEFAAALIRAPGGGALNAIGAARLGLRTAAAFTLGEDEAGIFLRSRLAAEGIVVIGEPKGATPVTVVLPYQGDRALVTYDPEPVNPPSFAGLDPGRVVYTLDQVDGLPACARHYVTIGDREASKYAGRTLPLLPRAATVFLNGEEATKLTGEVQAREAAAALVGWADVVVVTRGGSGGVACTSDGNIVDVPGVDVDVIDTTGAGDLFAAAWIWAEARNLDLEARLRWSVLYAALSVRVDTADAGAVDLGTLLREGTKRGLSAPRTAVAS